METSLRHLFMVWTSLKVCFQTEALKQQQEKLNIYFVHSGIFPARLSIDCYNFFIFLHIKYS